MTTSKTPLTTDRIRDLYSWACAWRTEDDATEGESDLSGMRTSQRAEFNRWLAAHEAEVKAKALEEAATSLEGGLGVEGTPGTLYEYRAWLRARAAAIRGEQP